MNLSVNVSSSNKDLCVITPTKVTTLNPNAAEFVPTALRSVSGSRKSADHSTIDAFGVPVKEAVDLPGAIISDDCDDEAHLYWYHKLPDDLTPDFKFMGNDELTATATAKLSVAGLLRNDAMETSKYSVSPSSQQLDVMPNVPSHNSLRLAAKLKLFSSNYVDEQSLDAFGLLAAKNSDRRLMNGNQHLISGRQGGCLNESASFGLPSSMVNGQAVLHGRTPNPLAFLVSQFPGFAPEGVADVYRAHGFDLDLTMKALTRIKFQSDGNVTQDLKAKGMSSCSPITADDHSGFANYNRRDFQQAHNAQRSYASICNGPSGNVDFPEAVPKSCFQGSGQWKYNSIGSVGGSIGSSRISNSLKSMHDLHRTSVYDDKLEGFGAVPMSPNPLDTREAAGNMYSELTEGTRDFARQRDLCFDQAWLAYQNGNKELAKRLNSPRQLIDMQMKAAHRKAGENFHQERNSATSDLRVPLVEIDSALDLRNLHGSEALDALKKVVKDLRTKARSIGRRLLLNIVIGVNHQVNGTTKSPQLPMDIEQYLNDEYLLYTEPRPGLAQIVVC